MSKRTRTRGKQVDYSAMFAEDDEPENEAPSPPPKKKAKPSKPKPIAKTKKKAATVPEKYTHLTKNAEFGELMVEIDRLKEDLPEDLEATKSCNAMRSALPKFINEHPISQTAFLGYLKVNSNSFGRFMKLKGAWTGTQNGTYWAALRFFSVLKNAKKNIGYGQVAQKKNPKKANEEKAEFEKKLAEVAEAGYETNDDDMIYSNCDDVRKQVLAFIAEHPITQTRLCKFLSVNSNSYRQFFATKGKDSGRGHGFYYKAYGFLEKWVELHGGQVKKTAKRIRAEKDAKTNPYQYKKQFRNVTANTKFWGFR